MTWSSNAGFGLLYLMLMKGVTANRARYRSDGLENLMNTCIHVLARKDNAIGVQVVSR